MRQYLISVVSVCMIAVISRHLVHKEPIRKVVHFVSGLLILLVVTMPLLSLQGKELITILEEMGDELQVDTSQIEENAQKALEQHITRTAEEYIEKKARELGATVQANVMLTQEEYPVPRAVKIIGSLNLEQQLALSEYMSSEMGIAIEEQEWEIYG